jgi:PAS domain S-box-containing protein
LTFDELMATAREPAFVLDPREDRFIAANPSGCAMLGYTRSELLETPISRIHAGEVPQLHDFVARVLNCGQGTTIALTCRTRQGTCLPAEMALQAFEHDGRILVVALVRDRSEHRLPPAAAEAPHSRHSAAPETLGETNWSERRSSMVTTSLIVRLEAKAGNEAELAAFLRDAQPLVQAEPQTIAWFALKTGPTSFAIVDAFTDEEGRQAHLNGPVAAALLDRTDELLARRPEIEQLDVLAAKLP